MYKIMTVEDDADMRGILKAILAREGFEVVGCPDGRSALDAVAKEKPDLVLLDMHLPDINGLDVCLSLKSDARTKHIPVIILTGDARSLDERVGGLEAGADDYVFKPMEPKVLVSRIRSLLKLSTGPSKKKPRPKG